jgi:hypothetical protein
MAANDELIRLVLQLTGSKDIDEAAGKLDNLKTKLEKADDASKALNKTSGNTGQSLLQTGRVVQDFAQGGLGGVLNNIEGLTMALGLGSGLAGVFTVLGVAALTLGPSIKSAFKSLIDGSNEVPKSTDQVTAMTVALKQNKEALEELSKQQSLTNTELKEFNRLTDESIELEKKVEEAKAKKAQAAKLDALRPQGAADAERERATELEATFGGRNTDAMAKTVQDRIEAELERSLQQLRDLPPPDQRDFVGQQTRRNLTKKIGRLEGLKARGGKDIIGGAIVGGKTQDIETATEFMPVGPDRTAMRSVLPGEIEAWDKEQEAIQEGHDRAREARIKRQERAAKKRAADKKIDDLNEQGRDASREQSDWAHKDFQERLKEAREASNEVAKQARRAEPHTDAPRLQMMPQNASDAEIRHITLSNQAALNEMMAQDRQRLLMMGRDVQRGIQRNRTQQNAGTW